MSKEKAIESSLSFQLGYWPWNLKINSFCRLNFTLHCGEICNKDRRTETFQHFPLHKVRFSELFSDFFQHAQMADKCVFFLIQSEKSRTESSATKTMNSWAWGDQTIVILAILKAFLVFCSCHLCPGTCWFCLPVLLVLQFQSWEIFSNWKGLPLCRAPMIAQVN